MKRAIGAAIVLLAVLGLSGCKSDPACLFADDYFGCLVITDNVNSEVE